MSSEVKRDHIGELDKSIRPDDAKSSWYSVSFEMIWNFTLENFELIPGMQQPLDAD